MAAAGGHRKIVKFLLNSGAQADDENATGLNPLHIAAYYGQLEFVRTMLNVVPPAVRTEPPRSHNPLVAKEHANEYGFTPLHMAAQAGREGVVRLLLNYQTVQVDATSVNLNIIALHLASQSGHIAVVGMLLSRSTQQLHVKDSRGRTGLHLAAMNGHYDMVSVLIAQGSSINSMDMNGWTALHFATRAGHINVVKLLLQSNADATAETKEGKIALCFAAAYNHLNCLSFLMTKEHDTHLLMEDRKFIFDLMVCGRAHENRSIEDFILHSPAPIDTAVKLSTLYRALSEKEKERAKDLTTVAEFCEKMAVELLSIAAAEYSPALLLKAQDSRGRPFLDVLIENDQKDVVSHAAVQRYLSEILSGGVHWGTGKFAIFLLALLFCPPLWVFFSLPLNFKEGRAPVIKFICHLISHIYFTVLLIIVVQGVLEKIYEIESIIPSTIQWVLLMWLSGLLVAELTSFGSRSGLGVIRLIILLLSTVALAVHLIAFLYPAYMMPGATDKEKVKMRQTFLYIKNQFLASVLLFVCVNYLEFLVVHHLFGPWAVIITELMYDLARFVVILMLFVAGFTLQVTSIFQPAFQEDDGSSAQLMRLASITETVEMLYFSLFGLVEPDSMPPLHLVPDFAKSIMKAVFGVYMMVTLIVLINLLIAMMSDTYQRIQAQSDIEWKFGRAILIRQMNKKSGTPVPINLFTRLATILKVAFRNRLKMCSVKAQDDLNFEENIDAYSMGGQEKDGRSSPAPPKTNEDGRLLDAVETGGKSEDLSIESVIEWKRVVDIYFMFKGVDVEAEEKKDSADLIDERIDAAKAAATKNDRTVQNGDVPKA